MEAGFSVHELTRSHVWKINRELETSCWSMRGRLCAGKEALPTSVSRCGNRSCGSLTVLYK